MNLSSHPIWQGISPLKKRGHLARFFLAKQYARVLPRSLFIGITGSVGKTTTVVACKEVLSQKFPTLASTDTKKGVANLDPIFNLPMTILKVRPRIKKVVLEMGIEHPGEMEMYLSLVRPATAIITRIFYAHSEFLGNLEEIIKEKGKLVEQLPKDGVAILNWDDLNTRKLSEKTVAEVVYFGLDGKNCHVWADKVRVENLQTIFELNYGVERVEIVSNLLGKHQIYSLLAAASLGIACGIPLINIKKGLEAVVGLDHRMQVFAGFNGSTIIDDTYNSSPAAVEEAIETLNAIPARRRIVVLGEMRELGEYSEKLHRQIASKIYKEKIDLVLTGGGDANFIADELLKLGFIPERLYAGLQNPEIASKLLKVVSRGDVILVKGSRATRLDEVVKRITKPK